MHFLIINKKIEGLLSEKKMCRNLWYFFGGTVDIIVMICLVWLNVIYTPDIIAGMSKFPAYIRLFLYVVWLLFSVSVLKFSCFLIDRIWLPEAMSVK